MNLIGEWVFELERGVLEALNNMSILNDAGKVRYSPYDMSAKSTRGQGGVTGGQ